MRTRLRTVAGAVLVLIGLVWIAQGLDALKGSAMTGQRQWAVIGAIASVVGLGLIAWDIVAGRSSSEP